MPVGTIVVASGLAADAAFKLMIDLSNVPEWDRGIRHARRIDGEPGSPGARYEVTLTGFDGQLTTAVYELTAVDKSRSFSIVGTHPDFRADDTVTFESTNDGCLVTYTAGLTMLAEPAPVEDGLLAETFAKLVAIVEDGLRLFLNP